ncbi:hypothetical protein [Pseudonocardia sp.]|uniref:hypothetical protein n=1 Tax=Pseudonocardia sp. TaxID=60912 RepID=UPI0031FD6DDE
METSALYQPGVEPVRVVLGDAPDGAAGSVELVDPAEVGVVAHVLLDEHLAAVIDRDVVHHVRAGGGVGRTLEHLPDGYLDTGRIDPARRTEQFARLQAAQERGA